MKGFKINFIRLFLTLQKVIICSKKYLWRL
nr:MAG TPA: hypothetical protein [Caudoviricetes sp.]